MEKDCYAVDRITFLQRNHHRRGTMVDRKLPEPIVRREGRRPEDRRLNNTCALGSFCFVVAAAAAVVVLLPGLAFQLAGVEEKEEEKEKSQDTPDGEEAEGKQWATIRRRRKGALFWWRHVCLAFPAQRLAVRHFLFLPLYISFKKKKKGDETIGDEMCERHWCRYSSLSPVAVRPFSYTIQQLFSAGSRPFSSPSIYIHAQRLFSLADI